MLAPSAATLPRGHFLIEPYLFDVIAAHSNGFGSLTYVNYGLADKLTVGLIPTAGFNKISNGPSSSEVGLGDVTFEAQYRLAQFHAGSRIPTTSLAVQETLPTGKYDRLGDRPSDGLGSGAYTTTLALYSQTYVWLRMAEFCECGSTYRKVFRTTPMSKTRVSTARKQVSEDTPSPAILFISTCPGNTA